MSELIYSKSKNGNINGRLLATVSALALLVTAVNAESARASEQSDGSPTVWIELGAQMERVDGGFSPFAPPFTDVISEQGMTSPVQIQRPPRFAVGGSAAISIMPKDSDWVFSAVVRYGRSNRSKFVHEQTETPFTTQFTFLGQHLTVTGKPNYEAVTVKNHESHAVLDFSAGKDVGLGLFGADHSTVSVGVRFAQFNASGSTDVNAAPQYAVEPYRFKFFGLYLTLPVAAYDSYVADWKYKRSFIGVGPSASWGTSVPLTKSGSGNEFTLDLGLNGAVLFGRQKAEVHHKTIDRYHYAVHASGLTFLNQTAPSTSDVNETRSRTVVVPNIGAFAGFSLKFPSAKVSLGYRADLFLGAMDGGIDTRKTYDRDFYGPFATISIGLP